MGFFNIKETCIICENGVGVNKHKTKQGLVCVDCMKLLIKNKVTLWNIDQYDLDELKKMATDVQKIETENVIKKETGLKQKFCCPKCKGNNIDLVSTDKNMNEKHRTTVNLNPLRPFALFNTKTVTKEKKSASKIGLGIMTGGASLLVTGVNNKKHCEYFCKDCRNRWIDK